MQITEKISTRILKTKYLTPGRQTEITLTAVSYENFLKRPLVTFKSK